MGKQSYFDRTGKEPPPYMKKRGAELAACNKQCIGTKNNEGQFYKKVAKCLAISDKKRKKK